MLCKLTIAAHASTRGKNMVPVECSHPLEWNMLLNGDLEALILLGGKRG
jgi:hypothetical protein